MSNIVTKFAVTAALAIGLFAPVAPAVAASLTQSQIQAVTSLLVAFGVDNATIANVQAALNGTAATSTSTASTTSTTSNSTITANMIGNLHLGDDGEQVKYLQVLLAADPSIYPQGLISGYYGALTEAAVKRFQRKHDLEDVGFIGPQTLRNIESELENHPFAVATSTMNHVCAIVPPGHLIAPGWLRHHDGEDREVISTCQILPPGIERDQEHEDGHNATTTPDTIAPVISNLVAGNVTDSSAAVSWTTNEDATGIVNVGTTTSYGTSVSQGATLSTSHVLAVTGLNASTTYHVSVTSADASNNSITSGDMTFTTTAAPDTTAPVISAVSVGSIASTSAAVSWTTNEPATSKAYFGTTTPLDLGTALTMSGNTLTTSHSFTLSPLTASSTYYYVVESADSSNNMARTSEASFATLAN
ncbi:MAG: peptidoglycan-binding domain-containing protein [Minisyncoccota bacterium]